MLLINFHTCNFHELVIREKHEGKIVVNISGFTVYSHIYRVLLFVKCENDT